MRRSIWYLASGVQGTGTTSCQQLTVWQKAHKVVLAVYRSSVDVLQGLLDEVSQTLRKPIQAVGGDLLK